LEHGLLEHGTAVSIVENNLTIRPPCTVTPAEIARMLALLDEVLTEFGQR
jgi:taurine--2-oxoglutarate transaminase